MSCKVQYNSALHIVDVINTGHISTSDLVENGSKAIALSSEHDCIFFLVDSKKVVGHQNVLDYYHLPQSYAQQGLSLGSFMASVRPEIDEMREISRFWENVCINCSFFVQSFDSREEAIEWLQEMQRKLQ